MTNFQKVKRILLADNAWDAVIAETELFGPTIAEMEGVPHVNYHAEGGVLDHVNYPRPKGRELRASTQRTCLVQDRTR